MRVCTFSWKVPGIFQSGKFQISFLGTFEFFTQTDGRNGTFTKIIEFKGSNSIQKHNIFCSESTCLPGCLGPSQKCIISISESACSRKCPGTIQTHITFSTKSPCQPECSAKASRHTHIYIYICIHLCSIYTYIHLNTFVCMLTHVYICRCVYTCICIHIHLSKFVCMYIHIYTLLCM